MSKDICLFVERKFFRYDDSKQQNGVWVSIDKWTQEPDFYLYKEDTNIVLWKVCQEDRMYDIGNRTLFAVLCNYENRNDIKYISEPKGLPKEVSHIVREYHDYCLPDVYNSSWLLLSELLEYPWNDCNLSDSIFVKEFLNKLQKIDKPENIRIIFWIN
jgi:hypothetical protein